jgi:hypothetical protein
MCGKRNAQLAAALVSSTLLAKRASPWAGRRKRSPSMAKLSCPTIAVAHIDDLQDAIARNRPARVRIATRLAGPREGAIRTVKITVRGADLSREMAAMREWLDRNRWKGARFEPVWGFSCQVVVFGFLPVLCSERESRSSSRRLGSGWHCRINLCRAKRARRRDWTPRRRPRGSYRSSIDNRTARPRINQ